EALDDLRSRAYVPFTGDRLMLRVVGRQPLFSLCAVENAVDAIRHALSPSVAAGVYNVADAVAYGQDEVRSTIAAIDRVSLAMPIPRTLASTTIRAISTFLPHGDSLRAM